MIRILKIIMVFFLIIIFGAPSCVNEEEYQRREEVRLNKEIEQIYLEVESMDLTDSVLLIYQSHAQERLMDIADYFQILSDTSLDLSMREKAGDLLLQNFITEEVKISFYQMNNKEITLSLYIENVLNDNTSLGNLHFDSIYIEQPLMKWDNVTYKGQINYQQMSLNHSLGLSSMPHTIDFYLAEEEKIIGSDTLVIWDIQFGNIR